MKKIVIACVLGLVLAFSITPAAFGHSHVETGNGECVTLPDSYHGEDTRGHAGFGIGVAKGGTINPNFPPADDFWPGNIDGYPTQSADSAIEGGGCGSH